MNPHHHPSEALLLDYATGAMGEAYGIALATHAALCPECRQTIAQFEAIGGALFDDVAETKGLMPLREAQRAGLNPDVLLDEAGSGFETGVAASPGPAAGPGAEYGLPQPLRGYLMEQASPWDETALNWRRIGVGAYQILIPTGQPDATARLLRIPAGKPVPHHTHHGIELTLVLDGAFSDVTGHYGRGDMQEADDSLDHQPHAAPGTDCICLAVTSAPLRFSSAIVRFLQPWLGI